MSNLKEVYDPEWERQKENVIRSMFEDIPPLSPIAEEVEPLDSNQSRDVNSAQRSTSSSPYDLPPLIIEKEPSIKNKHDEPEEYYKQLAIRMRKAYRQLFIEGKNEVDLDLSDSPITSPQKRVFDEENKHRRSLIDWSTSDGDEGHFGSRRDEDDEMGGNGEDKNGENEEMEVRVSNGKEFDIHESSSEVFPKSTPESSGKSESEMSSHIFEEGDAEPSSENIRVAGNSVNASPETEVLEELEVMRTPCYRPSGSLLDKYRSIGVEGESSGVERNASVEEKSSCGKEENASKKKGHNISGKEEQAVEVEEKGKSRRKRRRISSPFSAKRPKYEDA